MKDMLLVEVTQLFLSNVGFVVLLEGDQDERSLPIFIGAAEAQSIAIFINGGEITRPLTHDLMKNMLDFMECRLMRVEITDIKEETFFAQLIIDQDGTIIEMDCRPSDAIAISLRCSAPIYAAKDVIEKVGHIFNDEDFGNIPHQNISARMAQKQHAKNVSMIHKRSPIDSLKAKQDRAVKEERYEDAARLRDAIEHLNQTHTEN